MLGVRCAPDCLRASSPATRPCDNLAALPAPPLAHAHALACPPTPAHAHAYLATCLLICGSHRCVASDELRPSPTGLSFHPLGPDRTWGVEVHGLDLKRADAAESLPELADALHRFGYLLVRGQHLSPAQHVATARKLAPMLGAVLPPTSSADNGILDENLVPGATNAYLVWSRFYTRRDRFAKTGSGQT
jgi:hypothetical protein